MNVVFQEDPTSAGRTMHELSIAGSLVELAEEQLLAARGARAKSLLVRVGPLSGVVVDALRFAFEPAARGSGVEGARLDIYETSVTLHCARCDASRPARSNTHLVCATCGEPSNDVLSGRELELVSIELLDVEQPDAATHS